MSHASANMGASAPSNEESGADVNVDTKKRASSDTPENAPKTKRSRYVSNACNECKRRKVKCNGEEPCLRCINSMIACSYRRPPRNLAHAHAAYRAESLSMPDARFDEGAGVGVDSRDRDLVHMSAQLRTVMDQVDHLNERWNKMTSPPGSDLAPPSNAPFVYPAHATNTNTATTALPQSDSRFPAISGVPNPPMRISSPTASETLSPEFHGPTSSEFTFKVANESMGEMGIGSAVSHAPQSHHTLALAAPSVSIGHAVDNAPLRRLLTRDPLWKIDRADADRWIQQFHCTLGAMYPVVDAQHLHPKVQYLFDAIDAARVGHGRDRMGRLIELLFNSDTNKIKVIIAIGLINDVGVGNGERAVQLIQSVLDTSDDSLMNAEGIGGVQLLVLVSLFYFNIDEELKASRYSCLASRRALELGLHRRDFLLKHFTDDAVRRAALRIFWSVFTIDRRSSLGLGVPYVIQDSLVDPALVAMNFDHLYLRTMIPFTKLSGKAWQMSNEFSSKPPDVVRDEIDYLDYQVLQWQQQIPDPLRYSLVAVTADPDTLRPPDLTGQQRLFLSVALLVRGNQLRNVIFRPLLQSTASITGNPDHTLKALAIAKDSLQALADLDAATSLLESHALFFKHFIVSAIGNLLLIAVHGAADFWPQVRETFHMALDLLRKLSTRSGAVMRVWDRLKGLENLQTKIASARRRGADPETVEVMGAAPDMTRVPGEAGWSNLNLGGGSADFMLFDSQIRDEFAGFFDSTFDIGDFFEFPMVDQPPS